MELFDRRTFQDAARSSVDHASYSPKKLILIHTGGILLLDVLMMLVTALLDAQMNTAGGLGGMGLRAALSTLQTVLVYALVILPIFWQMGYTHATMQISRREHAGPGSLLEGFRKFGPVLRLSLLQAMLYLGVAFLAMYIAVFLFSFFPQSEPLFAVLANPIATEEVIMEATMAAYPYIIAIFLLAFLPFFLPMFYRYRMASFCLLDAPYRGARAALRESQMMMKGNRMSLFKLDLSFWWFIGLELLASLVVYGHGVQR